MKIFTSEQVRRLDAYTIENEPIESIDLMERASRQIAFWISGVFENRIPFIFLVGPGNNGGDGMAVARLLSEMNYMVEVFMIRISDKLSPDAEINFDRLKAGGKVRITEVKDGEGLENYYPFGESGGFCRDRGCAFWIGTQPAVERPFGGSCFFCQQASESQDCHRHTQRFVW